MQLTARRLASTISALLAAATLTLTAATPASAAPNGFSFSTKGLSADAFFSDLPQSTAPVAGQVYTDVFISAADQAVTSDGQRFDDRFVLLDIYSYTFDRRGNFVPVSARFGVAGGDAVTLTGDRRLTSAALSAQVELQSCDDRRCSPAGTTSVSATWTGTGETTRVVGSFRVSSRSFSYHGRVNGSSRQASASASIPGVSTGPSLFASLFYGSSSERYICHRSC